ncbi:MAG: coproporphyrinogen III oxidase family protein [Desulfobacteraceae bacterium]|nr:MAG: coproporphyrinogen III oxidase family protein [Desulfobacteraceae bacterium]
MRKDMTDLPYPYREAVPLYFYPFLSPLTCQADAAMVHNFHSSLQERKAPDLDRLIYIHIPFCKDICFFCGFYRDAIGHGNQEVLRAYVESLKAEIKAYSETEYLRKCKISAVYFGGGTPTILGHDLMDSLLRTIHDSFAVEPGTELSYEGEVRTLKDKDKLKVLKALGCTRVSFGVQTFNERARRLSGLKPTMADIRECIDNINEYGFDPNLDLMYGLPGQTESVWESDLKKAIELRAANIDIYDTVLYPHTILFRQRHKLKNELPTLSQRLTMMEMGMRLLVDAGYTQETIEDFHLPSKGYKMKRLVYGGGDGRSEILACGAAAVGVLNGYSYRNLTPQKYLNWWENRKLPPELMYRMTDEDFRKRALVFFPKVLELKKECLPFGWLEQYRPIIDGMKDRQLIEETSTSLMPTEKGMLWADNMAMEFLETREQRKIWKIGH